MSVIRDPFGGVAAPSDLAPSDARSGTLLPILLPVTAAGLAAVAAAAVALAMSRPSLLVAAGLAALLVAAALAEAFPVPLDLHGVAAGGVSLAAVFIVGTAVLYGWAPAAAVAFVAVCLVQLAHRRPPVRVAYNGAVYALSGAAAGALASLAGNERAVADLLLGVTLAAAGFYAVNVSLVGGVVARAAREPLATVLARSVRSTALPFSIMASVSLILTVLWERSPFLMAALVGPLVAIGLYQRSVHEALDAMRLALTDPLTGLGNHRHFRERLERDLNRAQSEGTPLALCLVDVDNFKQINDRYGHPVGDRVLAQVAARLRHGGEAFRLGGDEFAILLPGRDDKDALLVAEHVLERVAATECEHGERVTVSAGVASYPQHGIDRSELVRVADWALYWSKEHGKSRVRVYRPDVVELAELRRLADPDDGSARFRAAAGLARVVDSRDAYTGEHSAQVGELAARVAARMGLEPDEIELIRLAGSLHDLGKLAVPEEILRKPGRLTDGERGLVEQHPRIAFHMLDSLEIEPITSWVLHHHERWDGGGYPNGLAGDGIPLGARIVFAADAYDAMTTDRVYRARLSHEEALAELERCAGTQFDPDVVAALKAEVAEPAQPELAGSPTA